MTGVAADIGNRWRPSTVLHPDFCIPFTEDGAWEHLSDCLFNFDDINVKTLSPNEAEQTDAHYMLSNGAPGEPRIYMKVTLVILFGEERVIGLSFHDEDPK